MASAPLPGWSPYVAGLFVPRLLKLALGLGGHRVGAVCISGWALIDGNSSARLAAVKSPRAAIDLLSTVPSSGQFQPCS